MNLLRKVCLFGAIALVFMSCSEKNEVVNPDLQGKTPIRLSSSVSLLRSGTQNTQLANGQKVGFFLNLTDETDYNINNNELTANGEGNFTHTPMYYPTEGSTFEFSAYHPYTSSGLSDGKIKFTVKENQSVKTDYFNSDLLHATKTDIVRTLNAVPLTFAHKLSKVTFIIKKGEGFDISELSKIEILNVSPSVDMDIITGSLSNVSETKTDITAYGVQSGTEGVLSISGSAAIIVPQTIASGSKLLRISFGEITYSYTTTENIEFENGKSYEFQIEIGAEAINVTSTISEWEDGDSIEGGGIRE